LDTEKLENRILLGDCLKVMEKIPDKSIDMILCDLPYGTTACKWDTIIPLDLLWKQYNRIIKDHCAIVLTASQPFTSVLVISNLKWFKYEWIWEKASGSNFAIVKYQPMKEHESVLIFGNGRLNYYPIMQERKGSRKGKMPKYPHGTNSEKSYNKKGDVYKRLNSKYSINRSRDPVIYGKLRNPSSVQFFNNRIPSDRSLHPTQKPVTLFEYLIKTYTNEKDIILDNCIGSGTTAIACMKNNRKFIGIEKELEYVKIAKQRIKDYLESLKTKSFEDMNDHEIELALSTE
jgi:site-specific DNA-methyltransferase (adenine-specific)